MSTARGPKRAPAKPASLATNPPTFEHIVTGVNETFLWRLDNYPWERNVWNFHPEIEIHLIRKASGLAFVGDHIGQFGPGYLTVIGSNLPHDWVTVTEPDEIIEGRDIVMQFHPDRMREITDALPEFAELEAFFARAERGLVFHNEARAKGADLIERMGSLKGLSRFSLFIQLLDLLVNTEEYELLSSPEFAPELDQQSLDVLRGALAFIYENIATDIHLADLARQAGMSETAFSRFFKKNTGNTFTDHVNKLRIWQACKLLAETDVPITDICFEVGYLNISNFNRTFLRQHKMTPSAYRRLTGQRRTSRS
ncbi:AraC family transcriptional regulator [Ensifer sp. ENS06]|uniref:helix-turn-helix domain-containing protein n=1 Tax=unclassified Ensifer TaxID=2633371 RepID=UPI000DDD7FC0|nr:MULTISPECIES: AraC family transcriptional regulator [unclassified Ensifer]MBD9595086.1 AraC family transcriptional regulator [Ensifer sp. ENS05]MBD9624222.1 AraC family transcriptional regulator [Ensifer sp. ENS06]